MCYFGQRPLRLRMLSASSFSKSWMTRKLAPATRTQSQPPPPWSFRFAMADTSSDVRETALQTPELGGQRAGAGRIAPPDAVDYRHQWQGWETGFLERPALPTF